MRSSKSRSRKPGRNNAPNRSVGNIINRVFDSSGPEGKVRGTPQQIIDKYNQLARDAQLGNDRVAMENFQQHAEHYLRLLAEAQREIDQRREQQERENRDRQAERDREQGQRDSRDGGRDQNRERPARQDRTPDEAGIDAPAPRRAADPADSPQPDLLDLGGDSGLVETPETNPKPRPRTAPVKSAPVKPAPAAGTEAAAEDAPKPKLRPRSPRKPKPPAAEGGAPEAAE